MPISTGLQFALVGGGLLFNYLLNRNRDREQRADEGKRLIRGQTAPARWIAGQARVGGVIAAAFELERSSYEYVGPDGVTTGFVPPSNTLHMAVLISAGTLDSIDRIWINGTEMPFARVALGGSLDGALVPSPTAFDGRVSELRTRAAALGSPSDQVLASLQRELVQRADDLAAAQAHRWFWERAQSGVTGIGPTAIISPDLGGAGQSPADRAALRASALSAAEAAAAPRFAGRSLAAEFAWDSQHRMDGISWAWIELANFHDNEAGTSLPWAGGEPSVEFLVTGSMGGNPASVARWFLTQRCGVRETEIDAAALATAEARCAEQVDFPLPTAGSSIGRAWLTAAYGPEGAWPSAGDRDLFIREVWNRYGGPRPRYSFNAIIEGDEERGSVTDALAGAMAGSIIDDGERWLISAGGPQSPVATLNEDALLAPPSEQLAPAVAARVNSYSGSLAYDSGRDWNRTVLPPVRDEALAAAEGVIERNVGDVPGAADEVTGRRLLAIQLRRASPTLRRVGLTVAPGRNFANWTFAAGSARRPLTAGQTVQLDMPTWGMSTATQWLIESVQPQFDGSIQLGLVQERPDTYSADLNLAFGALWGGRERGTGLPAPTEALGVNARAFWVRATAADGSAPFQLAILMRTGNAVRSLAMRVIMSGLPLGERRIGTLSNGDRVDVPASGLEGGEWVHVMRAQGTTDPWNVIRADRSTTDTPLSIEPYPGKLVAGVPTGRAGPPVRVPVLSAVPPGLRGLIDVAKTEPKTGQIMRRTADGLWTPADPFIISGDAPVSDAQVPTGTIWFQVAATGAITT